MQANNEHSYFINQLYRDFLLPKILGEDTKEILYWAGKQIARHYALSDVSDLTEFFEMSEFGALTLVKEKRASQTFELTGQSVTDRLDSKSTDFELEAGIIAETLEKANDRPCEASVTILTKEQKVQIIAQF
ncbi:YslB family protein [Lactobacillus psittaci]|uniref:DUF2507 domain-containing protein n=1 Tax=Lactobacillus psittaci DSM 15354 TaxID=1122152 RepID=A0A0R1SCP3_9LACO|nr:YslB family protein [Lactobacillus psittaci]KRL63051.1 hypothetical protein FC23_GL000988 [Lactobacillus psittaci DSM 15354]